MVLRFTAHATVVFALGLLASCHAPAEPQRRGMPSRSRVGQTAVQALIGVTDYHKLTYSRTGPGGGQTVEADLSTMPAVGLAGQYAFAGRAVEFGLDGGVLFSWEGDRDAVALGGGTVVVTIDRSLLLVDGFIGPYLSVMLADRVRLYGAAGASLIWADAEYKDEIQREQATEFGVGGYARAGFEFRLVDRSFLGLGARWVANELDFGGAIGEVDVEGWQWMLTYTQGF